MQNSKQGQQQISSLVHRLLQEARLHLGHHIVYDVVIYLPQVLRLLGGAHAEGGDLGEVQQL